MLFKHKSRSHRKPTGRGWNVVFRRARAPRGGHISGPLPLPATASMKQRTIPLPKLPAATSFPAAPSSEVSPEYTRIAALAAAERVTTSLAARPAYEIDPDLPLFRDEKALVGYEERRDARLRRLQRIGQAWSDGTDVSLGSDQGPQTITWSTAGYREFAGGTHPKAGAR